MSQVKKQPKDEFDLDFNLDLDEEPKSSKKDDEITPQIEKGMDLGIKQGLKNGIKDGIKPLAEKAGEEAIKNLMSGTTGSPVQKLIEEQTELARLEGLKRYITNMNTPQQPAPQQQQALSVGNQLVETLNTLSQLGIDPKDLIAKLGPNILISLLNPSIAPLMMLLGSNNQAEKGGNDMNTMLPVIMQLLNQQQNQHQPQQQTPTGNNDLLIAFINQQQALQTKIFELQQEAQKTQQSLLMEQIKPYGITRKTDQFFSVL